MKVSLLDNVMKYDCVLYLAAFVNVIANKLSTMVGLPLHPDPLEDSLQLPYAWPLFRCQLVFCPDFSNLRFLFSASKWIGFYHITKWKCTVLAYDNGKILSSPVHDHAYSKY